MSSFCECYAISIFHTCAVSFFCACTVHIRGQSIYVYSVKSAIYFKQCLLQQCYRTAEALQQILYLD
jgi:hypothetical protein